jgi:hypothetical protein
LKTNVCKISSSTNVPSHFTFQISNRVSVRLYQDCQPVYLETAPLQKGLVLMLNGKELVEEGIGFGVPVVKYADKTYFSGTASSWIQKEKDCCILIKAFNLDMISKKRFGANCFVNDKILPFSSQVI